MPKPSHTRIHLATISILVLCGALFAAGCGGGSSNEGSTPPDYSKLTSSKESPALAALYKKGNELLDGGQEAFDSQMEELKGFPAVVNVWASWCGPCRAEFPHLQDAAAEMGNKVAFLGVNPKDENDLAQDFLDDNPVPYPSFTDPGADIADNLGATHGLPATAFFDSNGELVFTKSGSYTSVEALEADVKMYAIDGGDG